jgi:hypothetical protein
MASVSKCLFALDSDGKLMRNADGSFKRLVSSFDHKMWRADAPREDTEVGLLDAVVSAMREGVEVPDEAKCTIVALVPIGRLRKRYGELDSAGEPMFESAVVRMASGLLEEVSFTSLCPLQ